MFATKLMGETKETKNTLPQFCRTEITSDSIFLFLVNSFMTARVFTFLEN